MPAFTIAVPDEVLDDLRSRLARTRYTQPSAEGWKAGVDPAYLRSLVEYWAHAGLHVIHGPFPADYDEPITPAEQIWLDSEDERDLEDGGYSAILATRPDTVAAAVIDSPAGMAAFIIDKLRDWSDCGGDLESRFDKDSLCELLTLYWVTDSIGTSLRQDLDLAYNGKRPTIPVPVAVTQSHEWNMPLFPRSIAERAASDIRQYSAPDRGGHFMAFEEPRLVADELSAFMRDVG